MNYDAWLERPYQESLRNGEVFEDLEEQYLESDEFRDAFEIWQRDEMPEYMPIIGSPLDTYMDTSSYTEGLNSFIQIRIDQGIQLQVEWERMMFSDDYAEETRRYAFNSIRKWINKWSGK